jgi:hypothetical protein
MLRYAIITITWERDNPAAYLPSNYRVIYTEPSQEPYAREGWKSVMIAGEDNAGWGLDSYVLPRLASGNMHGKEIDLSHDIMNRIPDLGIDTLARVEELRREIAESYRLGRVPEHQLCELDSLLNG